MEWAAIWCRALFIGTAEHQTVAYRAVAADSSSGVTVVSGVVRSKEIFSLVET